MKRVVLALAALGILSVEIPVMAACIECINR